MTHFCPGLTYKSKLMEDSPNSGKAKPKRGRIERRLPVSNGLVIGFIYSLRVTVYLLYGRWFLAWRYESYSYISYLAYYTI
ncbi:hypothetical protein VCRA217O17_20376 [Vibrio crassostreae]|nr:hypothetical protein VCRA2133O312_120089 [Vibrio crassostreae]CAK3849284.1 hypothetical protein VCRA217O17_20376 [Vibrio crassostreae]